MRHDALVTRSLFEEEKSRIAAINARRMRILNEFVNVLAYVRPRLVEARREVPSLELQGVYVSPVAASLAEDYEATDELKDMLDLFRDVPVSWLNRANPLLGKVTNVSDALFLLTFVFMASCSASIAAGLLAERIALRPLRDAPRIKPLITSLGASIAFQNAIMLSIGPQNFSFLST